MSAVAVVGEKTIKKPKPSDKPFSVRLSADERAYLREWAGNRPLGAFMRETVLEVLAKKRRKQRRPQVDDRQLASVLAVLGESRLSSNLNQLARHANMGTLDISPEIEQELHDAYKAVVAMRDALLAALGAKVTGE